MFCLRVLCVLCVLCACISCEKSISREIVLYTSVDEPIARPIIAEFEKQTGIRVLLVTDAEAMKTVGLAERLRAEKDRPQCNVWWGNEIFHTINLAEEGIFTPYQSSVSNDIPEMFRDAQHRWAGSGIRVRAIVGSPSAPRVPQGLVEMTDPAFKDHLAMARPTAGTTGSHVAAIYAMWGNEKADQFFHDLHANGMKLLGGNSVVAEQTAQGTIWAGLTDNDDVSAAQKLGSVNLILPDQDTIGTLVIPCTVAMVKPSVDAERLIDYLLSRQVEQKLIDASFAYASVRDTAAGGTVKAMEIDFPAVAKIMPVAVRRATDILEGR
jgi:iron(III) transport system substrate-binding protein